MRVNRGLLGWGVFFIVLGSVPLAVREGLLDPAIVRRAWELWPLILVGIGLGLILARSRVAVLGGLVVAVTFGLMGGALIATGFNPGVGVTTCGFGAGDEGTPFAERRGTMADGADAGLEMSCGTMTVTAAEGNGWTLAGTSDDGRPPALRLDDGGLVVVAPDRAGLGITSAASTWQVTLPRTPIGMLSVSVNAGSADVDLAGMTVGVLEGSVNAGEARLDLSGARGTRTVSASVNAGSLVLLLPVPGDTLGGEISVNAGSASICAPAGMTPSSVRNCAGVATGRPSTAVMRSPFARPAPAAGEAGSTATISAPERPAPGERTDTPIWPRCTSPVSTS